MTKLKKGEKQRPIFDESFLEKYAGSTIISDQRISIFELIANAWDAGATEVRITWPLNSGEKFEIIDNGSGMTRFEFEERFRKLSYDRTKDLGYHAVIPDSNKSTISTRTAFGKNGKGRFGSFSFGDSFIVETTKNYLKNIYEVFRDPKEAFQIRLIGDQDIKVDFPNGTKIYVPKVAISSISESVIRGDIAMRFLADPSFNIYLNEKVIDSTTIPQDHLVSYILPTSKGNVTITVIDVVKSDKSTTLHGLAWRVAGRLVGECTWKGSGSEHLIDGRKTVAKRYQFWIEADILKDCVLPDWTGFIPNDKLWQEVSELVFCNIRDHLLHFYKEERDAVTKRIFQDQKGEVTSLSIKSHSKWDKFINQAQIDCPSLSENDLEKLSKLLITLEESDYQYKMIEILSLADSEQLDHITELLTKWNIDFMRTVMSELEQRLKLLTKLKLKIDSTTTKEVQELQPLFKSGLWILGPEYESILYSSNEGMAKVIQKVFGTDYSGYLLSSNRPDFVVKPDSTVGLYSVDSYNSKGEENGVDRLTIIELKRPGLQLTEEVNTQCTKYVTELRKIGLIQTFTRVSCYALGSEIEEFISKETERDSQMTKITLLTYDQVIRKAEARLFGLYNKVQNAPIIQEAINKEIMMQRSNKDLFGN